MKTPIRYQSQLPMRHSYKPARRIRLKFSPGKSFTIPVHVLAEINPVAAAVESEADTVATAA